MFLEDDTVRENTEECRLREKIRSLEIEMKELIELHSLEFQVIKEQLKEEEQQRKRVKIVRKVTNVSRDDQYHVIISIT